MNHSDHAPKRSILSFRPLRFAALAMSLQPMIGCGASYGPSGYAPDYESESGGMDRSYAQAEMASEAYPAGDIYAQTEESPVVDTRQETRATFSLDVDTASYTRMRAAISNGGMAVPASVRAEEYINFFRYDDASPALHAEGAPFSAHIESAPSPFGPANSHLLRVQVRADDVDQQARPAANLVFLIDTSGSMSSPNKLPLVQRSLEMLVDALQPTDTVGIVTYSGSAGTLLEPTPLRERGRVLAAIQSLGAGGSTNGEGGIRRAYDLAAQHFREGGINRVMLASDGDFNVGVTGDALIELIERFRDRDITLTTLGFGSGNDRDMERLADHGNGMYAYVDNMREAQRVLRDQLSGTLQVVAKDAKVQVDFDASRVASFRLIGYDNRILEHDEFEDDAVDAGDVGAGQSATAYFEYTLRDDVQLAPGDRIASVNVRYKNPDEDESRLTEFEATGAMHHELAQTSAAFRFGAAVAEFAEVLAHSQHAETPSFGQILELATPIAEGEDRGEFIQLVRTAQGRWQ